MKLAVFIRGHTHARRKPTYVCILFLNHDCVTPLTENLNWEDTSQYIIPNYNVALDILAHSVSVRLTPIIYDYTYH